MGITKQMLECCEPDKSYHRNQNLNNLKEILKGHLRNKNVLLVLDDIWEIKGEWDKVLTPLDSSSDRVNMVLVTTRYPSIAKKVSNTDGISGEIIHLDGLDEASFWFLFKNCVFGDDQYEVPVALEKIGREIVEKLKSYPLAVKTVGALLKGNMDASYWMKILNSEKWKYQEGDKDIIPALRLSYEYLHVPLQRCFSYCSLFPKDYYFTAKELVYIWMAQDFLHTNDKRSVEDVGFEYLQELVERAFFQITVSRLRDVHYVIHDLMHDLSQVVSSEEIFAINHSQPVPKKLSLHHLSILQDVDTIENIEFHNLSSLVILEENCKFCSDFKWNQASRVRLLILPFQHSISYNFHNFTHLCHLRLTGDLNYGLEEKANWLIEICRLYHLQVLQLEDSWNNVWNWNNVQMLPKEFNNLVNLRHFVADKNLHSMIFGVGRLKHLQELVRFVVREEKGFELGQLSELKELGGSLRIFNLQNVKSIEEAEHVRLSEKGIVNLKLSWDKVIEDKPPKNRVGRGKWRLWLNSEGKKCGTTDASSEQILEALRPNSELRYLCIKNYGGCKSPSWLTDHSIKYLESIRLSNCEAWEELPNFGQLMCLKELYLSNLPKVKAFRPQFHGCSPQDGFPSLMVMHVSNMEGLTTWVWSQGYKLFPFLETLHVTDCPNLMEFSFLNLVSVHGEGTKWFPKLNHLAITNCPKLQQNAPPKIIPYIYIRGITGAQIDGGFGGIEYDRSKDYLKIHHVKDSKVLAFTFRTYNNVCSMEVNDIPNLTSFSWKCICMINSLKKLRFGRCHELCFSPVAEDGKDDGRTLYFQESIQELEITDCGVTGEELSYLLAHLPAIRQLSIENCHGIDFVSLSGIIDGPNRASLEAGVEVNKHQQRSPDSLMCLEELRIFNCPNMVLINEGGLSGLNALKEVIIRGSDKLLYSLNQKEASNYVRTLEVQHSNVTSLKLYSFVALRNLTLFFCQDLASVEGPNTPACPEVYIQDCPMLVQTQSRMVPKFLMHVGSLTIDNKKFLSIHANSFSTSLRSLTIKYGSRSDWNEWTEELENVVIKHLTALEELNLFYCKHLRSLPRTFHHHPSLKELTIHSCPEIKSLPQRGLPKTLQKLRLWKCSEELKSECSQLKDFECSNETDKLGTKYDVFSKRDLSVN